MFTRVDVFRPHLCVNIGYLKGISIPEVNANAIVAALINAYKTRSKYKRKTYKILRRI